MAALKVSRGGAVTHANENYSQKGPPRNQPGGGALLEGHPPIKVPPTLLKYPPKTKLYEIQFPPKTKNHPKIFRKKICILYA